MNGHVDLSRGFPERLLVAGDPSAEEVRRLWGEHGKASLPRLRGGFALAIWDEASQALILARDALGRKPLYYCAARREIWFGTRAPKAAPRGQLERGALSDYLELGYIPAPATAWSAVRKVPPGHLLSFDAKGPELRRWFETPVPGSGNKPSRIAVRARLEEAVRRRLAGDPWTLLSGGLDSSALVALMTRLSGRVRTYAAGSDEDLELARRIAQRFRTEHHELQDRSPARGGTAGAPRRRGRTLRRSRAAGDGRAASRDRRGGAHRRRRGRAVRRARAVSARRAHSRAAAPPRARRIC